MISSRLVFLHSPRAASGARTPKDKEHGRASLKCQSTHTPQLPSASGFDRLAPKLPDSSRPAPPGSKPLAEGPPSRARDVASEKVNAAYRDRYLRSVERPISGFYCSGVTSCRAVPHPPMTRRPADRNPRRPNRDLGFRFCGNAARSQPVTAGPAPLIIRSSQTGSARAPRRLSA